MLDIVVLVLVQCWYDHECVTLRWWCVLSHYFTFNESQLFSTAVGCLCFSDFEVNVIFVFLYIDVLVSHKLINISMTSGHSSGRTVVECSQRNEVFTICLLFV